MSTVSVLLEFEASQPEAFSVFSPTESSPQEAVSLSESLLDPVAGLGIELENERPPVPMFSSPAEPEPLRALEAFDGPQTSEDVESLSTVVAVRVPDDKLEQLQGNPAVKVWQNSELTFFPAGSPPAVDCSPFLPGATIEEIQGLLGVQGIWEEGHTGKGIVVGVIDAGIDGGTYPVTGGLVAPGAPPPGSAKVTSHGSMCAADTLIAAPDVTFYDYPFLGKPFVGEAVDMFHAVLDQRRIDGTPHLTNNSYGFTSVPSRDRFPGHEIWDFDHPMHRKVREVVASGAPAFFAAGNCGADCPSGKCKPSGIGAGKSIHASNSLVEVITIAAVNSKRMRIGYSSQGPGMFEARKPDLAAYSHIFANFGPGRPGGEAAPFDDGTSAACPVACGVAALLMDAVPHTTPEALKAALIASAVDVPAGGWDADFGCGVVHAGDAFAALTASGRGGRSAILD